MLTNSPPHVISIEKGFSLVEVLIAMVLALITFLIMFQMFDNWDKNKRTTAGGTDSQITGAIALYKLERDLRLAGFGFGSATDMGCSVAAYDSQRPDQTASGLVSATATHAFTFPLTPVQILNGASGAPDQIAALYGSSEKIQETLGSSPATGFYSTYIAASAPFTETTAHTKKMGFGSRGGIQMGDLVVAATSTSDCGLIEVTDNSNGDLRTIAHNNTPAYVSYYTGTSTTPRFNSSAGFNSAGPGRIYSLGPTPQRRIWQITSGRTLSYINDLAWVGATANTPVEVADNIVNLQAEYGYAATITDSGPTATCVASSTTTWSATTHSTQCSHFVWAIRVAVLARSDQFEKAWGVPADATGIAISPTWAGGTFAMTDVGGTADSYDATTSSTQSGNPADWRHYRYRVLESVIPLKNVMWGQR